MKKQTSKKHPNVVLVITDDQGYPDLGCTGNPWIETPNIDRFYEKSVRFNDFHVQPLCTPTRGAIMSGRRPIRNGAWATCWGRSILRKTETTMADIFTANGYHTGIFGKWHLGDNYPYRPFDRGFQRAVAHKGGGVGQTPDFWGNNYFDDTYFFNGQARKTEGYCTDVWFEQAMKFIDETPDDQPFFAYIATNAPHSPYLVADKYADRYRSNPDIPEPEFYGMITNIDENFGKLEKFLEEKGIADDTILIFMTDNGSSGSCNTDKEGFPLDGYNAGLRGTKGSYHDGGHKVPFIIRWPNGNITGGKDIDEMCLDIDMLPSFIELCGLENCAEKPFDGTSFAPLLTGEKSEMPDRVHCMNILQSPEPPRKEWGVVMTKRWRLVHWNELYDIKKDPGQKNNVADEFPEVVEELRSELNKWWEEVTPEFEDICHISLGNDAENPTTLVAMDVMGDVAWQQAHVIAGIKSTGTWNVDVEKTGVYRFSLRRWPEELPLPIEGMVSKSCAEGIVYPNAERKELKPSQARIRIFDYEASADVDLQDEHVTFEVALTQTGKTKFDAWFVNSPEDEQGAYYVVCERIADL